MSMNWGLSPQGDEKKGLEMLLKVRTAIESFYGNLVVPIIFVFLDFSRVTHILGLYNL